MAEPSKSRHWESHHAKHGAHYNNYACRDEDGMAALRALFPTGEADTYSFVLFSTSGVHGTYCTIEALESGEEGVTRVTFLVVHHRICCLRNGNCIPETMEDFEFLKQLRESSWKAAAEIGTPRPFSVEHPPVCPPNQFP